MDKAGCEAIPSARPQIALDTILAIHQYTANLMLFRVNAGCNYFIFCLVNMLMRFNIDDKLTFTVGIHL